MKIRILLIIIGLSVAGVFGVLFTVNSIENTGDQKTQEEWREVREDVLSEIKKNKISDPICFVVDKTTSGETGSAVTLDTCITLETFEEMGCTKPMLEHILRYSNLLDYEVDGLVYLDWAGLPSGVSQEEFDECYNAILEKRPILNSENQDEPNSCPDGQDYNQVLFKCVISCEDGLVYNGYTDSCTTEFELKYHGFCNEGFTYQPQRHTCLAENNPDDGIGDLEHIPLKDAPRTAPPEPEPEITTRYEKYLDENNELNFAIQYDKNGIIIDDLQRIYDWCDYTGEKPAHWYFDWNNKTHHIDSDNCKWVENEN